MLVAGLTGGIASGKSSVADMLKRAGAKLIDADVIAREVVAPGRSAWQAIVDQFGAQVIGPDDHVDRVRLGEMVFQDAGLRRRLEKIIHPRVRAGIDKRMAHLKTIAPHAVVIQDIPLLFEAGMTRGLGEVIVVYVTQAVQLHRLMERDGIDKRQALARIKAQMPLEEKRRLATLVIDNNAGIASTEKQALEVYARLSRRARQDNG